MVGGALGAPHCGMSAGAPASAMPALCSPSASISLPPNTFILPLQVVGGVCCVWRAVYCVCRALLLLAVRTVVAPWLHWV